MNIFFYREKISLTIILKTLLICVITVVIALLDFYAYQKKGLYSIWANRLWIGGMIWFYCQSLWFTGHIIWQDIRKRKVIGIVALMIVTILASFKINSFPITLSGEGAIEENTALEYMNKADWGYTDTVLFGNISRQYIMTALPSYFLGRDIVTHRLGPLLIFLSGIYMFYTGLRYYYSRSASSTEFASLAVIAMLSFPVVIVMLRVFDAVILPLAFTLQTIGFFLIVIKKPSLTTMSAFIWIFTMLSTVYTPALSPWFLLTFCVFIISIREFIRKNGYLAILWLSCFILSLSIGYNAYRTRSDIKLPQQNTITLKIAIDKSIESFEYFFIKNTHMYDQNVLYVGQLMFFPTVVYLIGAVLFFWNFKHFALSLWIIATIIISGLSPGYARPPIHYGIHRALVVLPFFLFGLIDVLTRYKIKLSSRLFFLLFVVLISYNTYSIHSIYRISQENFDIRAVILRETLSTAKKYSYNPNTEIQLGIFTKDDNLKFMEDHFNYFLPKYSLIKDQSPCTDSSNIHSFGIFYIDPSICSEDFLRKNRHFSIEKISSEILKKKYPQLYKVIYIPSQKIY
ncbi:hypothetical protein A2Y99_02825 [Candidatus Gottesmanbacteria bacterium RBG_13_37_7]|uniref:Glycosyltransferase RgtA/B/C/D-like domain-containing protein n=1 Tax=Candidatus Gottesmanbacteria bacterium RBG_13_37_7 TaxID=1798369 RepID=A0A1F5YHB9_9BACT|nr:MAG: hypothetical protein A2Y99_02825 [Candidatus Gottesmanbacteria bacterium RBG_13_37_7]